MNISNVTKLQCKNCNSTRWEDDVRKDIQKSKGPNWKTLVQDRRRWKELVEKAKTLHKEL